MNTIRIYETDSHARRLQARVLSCEESENGWLVELDRTIFYPTGGGQPCDMGTLGGGLGAFLILLAEPGKALWFILFLLILQQVEGNLIYPKVVGKSVGLPGLLVLMTVTIGGEAFGILGMLFSVPVCAVLYSLYLEFMKKASAQH